MRIGIDFDNTIANYDDAFLQRARELALIPENFVGDKQAVRDHVRALEQGELRWQQLQGYVYGLGIRGARLIDGVMEFLQACQERKVECFIVSHKTQFGHHDPLHIDLRAAARDWMLERGISPQYIPAEAVYFAETRAQKLQRIAELQCTHFIDDLAEVLLEPDFPHATRKLWYAPRWHVLPDALQPLRNWGEIKVEVLH